MDEIRKTNGLHAGWQVLIALIVIFGFFAISVANPSSALDYSGHI